MQHIENQFLMQHIGKTKTKNLVEEINKNWHEDFLNKFPSYDKIVKANSLLTTTKENEIKNIGMSCINDLLSDNFGLCQGAKIWLIPSSDYDNETKKLTAWNPTTYLFETDLITYDDSDTDVGGLAVGHGHFDMYIENTFHPLAEPDTYTITTTIVPK